ncbi:ATP-binding protein [Pseudomonas citronellolis]|uniref:ATP-binding protein n=1 Tax=Pseudomonas citronellolis TaxID=53408 RepID=UPI0023E35FF0|nr:ATP-binding protein [Pseudomonas citronellolis]MDF3931840.1 ATP-binding protein [Pseudomonas citronellolis]
MKRALTLRSRMFLSISALITLALIGLLLGVFSVMLMGREQERLISHNFATIASSQQLRQALDEQLAQLLSDSPDQQRLANLRARFDQDLKDGRARAGNEIERTLYERIDLANQQFQGQVSSSGDNRWSLVVDSDFSRSFNALHQYLLGLHGHAIQTITDAERRSRQHAWLIASLLGLVGLAILVIGFVTAHGVARRFGAPIEALARAADQIGKGDFDVNLPVSREAEMASLSRRFGLMAQALADYKASNFEAVLAGQKRLQAVLDSIDDGLVILDRRSRIEHANPVASRQLFSQSDPHGQLLGELIDNQELLQATGLVLRGESMSDTPQDLQVQIGGDSRLLAWTLAPVTHDDGRSMGAVLVLRDVTELRAFERVRSEFVLRASHELRTPVTGLHMAFALLRERMVLPDGARERELADTVDEEMQRLVRLIDDLLNFSRYQDGQQKLDRQPCAVGELLEQARQRFLARAQAHAISLGVVMEDDLPVLNVDRLRLERVLDNLVGNALRHTPDGGSVRLLAQRQGERLLLAVEDSGEGIAYSQQARIFEPFVQVGRRSGGAGLGLALCKEIVQLHGGRIGVRSQPGQGTRIYMLLPL